MAIRPIDADWLKNNLNKVFRQECDQLYGMLQLIDEAPTLTPPNEPLTSDELRQMDGEPVYIVFFPDTDGEKLQFWALVAVDEWGEVYLMNNLGGSSAYEEVWANIEAVYRRPPEGVSYGEDD